MQPLDTRSTYNNSAAQLQSIMNPSAPAPVTPSAEALAQEEVRKAMENGQIDKLINEIQEEQVDPMIAWQLLSKFGDGLSLAFTWPQQMIVKQFRSFMKPKIDKKAEFQKQSEAVKRTQIKDEVNKLRGQKAPEQVDAKEKGKGKQEVDVGVGQDKIIPGSLEWKQEMSRLEEMARVAQMIGSQKVMNRILSILLELLHLSKAGENAESALANTSNALVNMAESMKERYDRMVEALSAWVSPKVEALTAAYEAMAAALKRQIEKAAEAIQKRVKAIQEVVKKKTIEIAERLEPPIMKVIEPVKEVVRWGLDWSLERVKDAQDFVRAAAEATMSKAESAFNAVSHFVQNTVPDMVVYSLGWVYNLSPTTFNAIGMSFKGTYRAIVSVGKWLGSKSQQAYEFLKEVAIKMAKVAHRVALYLGNLLIKGWSWLSAKLIAFAKSCYRIGQKVLKWTVVTVKSSPQRLRELFYNLFHISKSATQRLAEQLENRAKRT
jgi:hypothetical protein